MLPFPIALRRTSVLASLLAWLCAWPILAQEREPRRVSVEVPQAGTYFLELDAAIPRQLGTATIRHTVLLDGTPVTYAGSSRGRGWNVGYVPYFTVRDRTAALEDGNQVAARLLFQLPLRVPNAQTPLAIQPAEGYSVEQARLRPAMQDVDASLHIDGDARQVFFAGDNPQATVTLRGPAGASLSGQLIFQHLRLADAWGASSWSPDVRVTEVERLRTDSIHVTLSDDGTATVPVDIPDDRHGLVGLTVILEDRERLWTTYLGAAAVVPPRDIHRFHEDGPFLASLRARFRRGGLTAPRVGGPANSLAAAYKKIGIDWVRVGPNWSAFEPQPGRFDWRESDALFDVLRRNHLYAMHLANIAPKWAWPDDPNLVEFRYKRQMRTSDWAPAQDHLDDWTEAHTRLYARYNDVIRASNVWNEPWEGRGITGWASTGDHYRRLVRGIRDAVDAADSTIKVVGADSGHNTEWKLFAAGMEETIDVISTHYASPKSSHAFSMSKYYDKALWETETWRAWLGDAASVRHILYYFANGGDKVSLWNAEMLFDHRGNPTPAAVSTAAVRHLLDGLTFRTAVHPERPPIVLLFKGTDRHVAAVTTTLAADVTQPGHFRRQFANDTVRMRLDGADDFRVYDLLANPITPKHEDGALVLDVDREPRFIEFHGSIEAFERRLSQARYENLRPVEIKLYDLTGRVMDRPSLRVALRNTHPRRSQATVTVHVDGLTLAPNPHNITLSPAGDEQIVEFIVTNVDDGVRTSFPTEVVVDTEQGRATLSEPVHVATIARGTPTVDGNLSEWPDLQALPVTMTRGSSASLDQQAAWFPWETFAERSDGFSAQVAFAADSTHLYLSARVRDDSQQILPSMLAGNNLHRFQNDPADHLYVEAGPIPGGSGDLIQLALGAIDEDLFQPKYEVYPPDHPWHQAGSYVATQYKYFLYPTQDGSAEVMRIRTPDFYYLHPFPIDYAWLAEHSRVDDAQVVVERKGDGYVYEAALPWSELKTVPHQPGDRIRMSMLIQDGSPSNTLEWARDRSVATTVALDFEPGWGSRWSSETQWTFVDD